ncbi:MAG TPA: hypothetical protein VGI70_11105 [Polyangiales bacterium]
MDNKDQRNASVPIGTFHTDGSGDPDSASSSETSGAYERVDDLPMEAIEDVPIQFGTTRSGGRKRARTRTLLGVPLPDVTAGAEPSVAERSDNISQAIQDMLESQAPRDSAPMLRDSEVELLAPETELAALSAAVSPPPSAASSLDDFETRQTHPGASLPLLIPSQYAEARERSLHDGAPAAFGDDDVTTTAKREAQPPTAAATAAAAAIAATANAPAPALSSAPNVSSLAPREVARPTSQQRDAAPGVGLLWVAGMLLVAGGGWLYTAGSFSRSHGAQNAPEAVATTAAVSQPKTLPAEPTMSSLATQPSAPAQPPPTAADARGQSVAAVAPPPTAPAPKPAIAGRKLVATSHAPRKAPAGPKLTPKPEEVGAIETPSRGEVVERMESVRSSVRACANGMSGVADLDITVAHNGAVTHVLVGGDFAGTPQGSCIARAVREARFSSFKQDRFRVLYPYAI